MKMNKLTALVLSAALTMSALPGFTTFAGNEETEEGRIITVNVGVNYDIPDLSPFTSKFNGRGWILRVLYQYLGDQEEIGAELKGVIAKEFREIDDYTYEVPIYDYVTDTEGNPVTADDVVWCFEHAKEVGSESSLNYLDSVEAIDDYTVKFVLNTTVAGGFEQMIGDVPIVSRKAFESSQDEMATDPVGTTGYKVTAFTSGSSLTVEKTGTYWQTEVQADSVYSQQNADKVVYKIVTEDSQMAIALETGEIDMGIVSAEQVDRFMDGGDSAEGFDVCEMQSNLTNVMMLNCDKDSVFYDNQALRQAIMYAVDAEAIVDGVLDGKGIACKTFGSQIFFDYNTKWDSEDYYGFDLEKAQELLEESGVNPGELKLRIMTDNSSLRNKIAEIIQAYLVQLGINSEILAYDAALFNSYKYDPTQWDIILDNKGAQDYVTNVYMLCFDENQFSNGTANFVHDDKLQELLLTAATESTHTPENVDAFHQYLKEQAYAAGLLSANNYFVCKDTVDSLFVTFKGIILPGASEYSDEF